MPQDRESYEAMRRPVLEKAGLHRDAIPLILDLERTCDDAIIGALEELSRTAAWKGRQVRLARTGYTLVYDGRLWRLADRRG